jgi:predicted metal-binding membrane protein
VSCGPVVLPRVTREHIACRIFGRDQRRERERVAEGEAAELPGREFGVEKLSALDRALERGALWSGIVSGRAASLRWVSLDGVGLASALLAGSLVAWIVTVARMRGMDDGPGTDLGGLGWYLGIWVTRMAAMMLPSVAPMVLFFARISREREKRGSAHVPTWTFVAAYFAVWSTYGFAGYGLYRLVTAFDTGFLDWDRAGPYVAGGAIAAAGLYELTPLKRVCLRHCRSPLHFLLSGWRGGRVGALRMGGEHGAYCVGCCWGLMVILFALGVMSLLWMAVVASLIFAQKVLPRGDRLVLPFAAAFVAFGIWIAVVPEQVPGLTRPGHAPAMHMSSMK